MGAKVQYSAQSSAPRLGTPRMLEVGYPESLLEELLASWRAGACAAGRRLVSEVDGLASHIRGLRAEIATPSFDQREAELHYPRLFSKIRLGFAMFERSIALLAMLH